MRARHFYQLSYVPILSRVRIRTSHSVIKLGTSNTYDQQLASTAIPPPRYIGTIVVLTTDIISYIWLLTVTSASICSFNLPRSLNTGIFNTVFLYRHAVMTIGSGAVETPSVPTLCVGLMSPFTPNLSSFRYVNCSLNVLLAHFLHSQIEHCTPCTLGVGLACAASPRSRQRHISTTISGEDSNLTCTHRLYTISGFLAARKRTTCYL